MTDGAGGGLASFITGQLLEKNCFPIIGGHTPYTAAQWTLHNSGTGAAIAEATTAGGGILITCPSDDDFNISLQSKQLWTPAEGKLVVMAARMRVSAITGIGFSVGIGNTQVQNFTTDFTDQVMIRKAILSADVYGRVRGNSGTAADTAAALGTMVNDTEIEVGLWFKLGSTAALSQGGFLYGGTFTNFTDDQRTQAFAILTSPPSAYFTVNATGVTGTTPTMTVTAGICQVDN